MDKYLDFTPWEKGCFQIYTGNGKGKTTASLGLCVRALAYGLKIYVGQFMKNMEYGENIFFKNMKNITIEQFGSKKCLITPQEVTEEDILKAKKGLEKSKEIIINNNHNIVVLDEITVALYFKLIKEKDLMELIELKPKNMELIFTGRYATKKIINRADLVTEMVPVTHPYEKDNLLSRDGIER